MAGVNAAVLAAGVCGAGWALLAHGFGYGLTDSVWWGGALLIGVLVGALLRDS